MSSESSESSECGKDLHNIATVWLASHRLTKGRKDNDGELIKRIAEADWELVSCCFGCGMDGADGERCECDAPDLPKHVWEEAQHRLSVKRVKADLTARGQHSDE